MLESTVNAATPELLLRVPLVPQMTELKQEAAMSANFLGRRPKGCKSAQLVAVKMVALVLRKRLGHTDAIVQPIMLLEGCARHVNRALI